MIDKENEKLETAHIKALAAASSTPFLTAFKIMSGIMLARILVTLVGLAALLVVVSVIGNMLK